MKIYGDYHTHTIYSHGKGTIEDNVKVAIKKGLKEIAICDHGPGHWTYGIKKENIKKARNEIDELNEKYKDEGIKIFLGVEANVVSYDGTIDVDDEILELIDILLLGYHFGALPKTIYDGYILYIYNFMSKFIPTLGKKAKEKNTRALIKAIQKYPVDIITHPNSKVRVDIKKLAREAAKRGTALEINASHSQLSVDGLKIALEEDVMFYINSDAHHPDDVGEVNEGIKRAIEAKVPINRIVNVK